MSKLIFITGNRKKFEELQKIIPNLMQLEVELPEIQELDPHLIIAEKIKEAFQHQQGEYIVEDTSLCMDALQGLPGPFIKWFLQTMGVEGIWEIVDRLGNDKAHARTLLGYAKSKEEIYYFEGVVHGRIVAPRGERKMGWDPIFEPEGSQKTFAEMNVFEKNQMSMRNIAAQKLKSFLEKGVISL